jgi:hypothetical protein
MFRLAQLKIQILSSRVLLIFIKLIKFINFKIFPLFELTKIKNLRTVNYLGGTPTPP